MLPDLPKQNKKKEADFGIKFRRWWEKSSHRSEPYELKDTRGKNSINFSELTDDQITIGLTAKSPKGVLIRIERGTIGAPDYVGLINCPHYWIVIKYPNFFCLVDIDVFITESARSKRRSLTSDRAKEITEGMVEDFSTRSVE